ncbi:hypothetical protein HK096_004519 [Nowakowskiella sp. JEL0078]|nr:hypothetical protein HK096_004519 [Nowakowskiella sp. JEL0078]
MKIGQKHGKKLDKLIQKWLNLCLNFNLIKFFKIVILETSSMKEIASILVLEDAPIQEFQMRMAKLTKEQIEFCIKICKILAKIDPDHKFETFLCRGDLEFAKEDYREAML